MAGSVVGLEATQCNLVLWSLACQSHIAVLYCIMLGSGDWTLRDLPKSERPSFITRDQLNALLEAFRPAV